MILRIFFLQYMQSWALVSRIDKTPKTHIGPLARRQKEKGHTCALCTYLEPVFCRKPSEN